MWRNCDPNHPINWWQWQSVFGMHFWGICVAGGGLVLTFSWYLEISSIQIRFSIPIDHSNLGFSAFPGRQAGRRDFLERNSTGSREGRNRKKTGSGPCAFLVYLFHAMPYAFLPCLPSLPSILPTSFVYIYILPFFLPSCLLFLFLSSSFDIR